MVYAGYMMLGLWVAASIACMFIQYKVTSKSQSHKYVAVPVCYY